MRRFLLCLLLALLGFTPEVSAVTRQEVINGWYGENLPTGEYAVAIPTQNKLVTHLGEIPFGPDSPLYLRITNIGGFKFAGQGHNTGATVEWNGNWVTKPGACGVSPLIYDNSGVLHISNCSIGSQGWRYVADNGTLITGDQSYAAGPPLSLYEYTVHGDISIGQGGNGGAVAVSPAGRFVLEPGHTTFIRYNRVGSKLAVSIVKLLEGKTVLLWLDASELPTFPREGVIVTPPPPPPPPPPPALTLIAPNRKSVVAQVIKDHPEIDSKKDSEAGRGTIVDYAAQRLNAAEGRVIWGRKSRGRPVGDKAVRPNTDGLTYKRPDGLFEIYDVIGGGSGAATWTGHGPFKPGENGYWAPPQLPAEGGVVVPPPPPPPDEDPAISKLKAELAKMTNERDVTIVERDWARNRVTELEIERDLLKAELSAKQAQLDALLSAPPPSCESKVPGWLRAIGVRIGCRIVEP